MHYGLLALRGGHGMEPRQTASELFIDSDLLVQGGPGLQADLLRHSLRVVRENFCVTVSNETGYIHILTPTGLYNIFTPPSLLSGRRSQLVLLRQLLVDLLTDLLHYRLLNERTSQLCVVVSNLQGEWNVTSP